MNKKLLSAVGLALALGASAAAQASVIVSINPDSPVGADPTISVSSLDWTVGNALSQAVTGSVIAPTQGDTFNTFAHARLGSFLDSNGGAINPTNFAANVYEWTLVTKFKEVFTEVQGPAGAGATKFAVVNDPTSFFEIWYDASPNGLNLTGNGFNGTNIGGGADPGAVKILSGKVVSGTGNFVISDASGNAPLDGFGANNYPGQTTVQGNGSTSLLVRVDVVDPNFFNGIPLEFLALEFTTEQRLNYNTQNPSACMWDGAAYFGGAGGQGTGCVATIGNPNGSVAGGTDKNVMFQADASNNFVPEPASLALMGLGLSALGLSRRRKVMPV